MQKMGWNHLASNLAAGGMTAVGGLLAEVPNSDTKIGGLALIGSGLLTFLGTAVTLYFRDRKEQREDRRLRDEKIQKIAELESRLSKYEHLSRVSVSAADAADARIGGIKGDQLAVYQALEDAGVFLPAKDCPTVLLVEDHPGIAQAMVRALKIQGFRVDHAATLAEAKEDWRAKSPDWILLDLVLPDGNGEDLLREVRKEGSDTCVAIITGTTDLNRLAAVKAMRPDVFMKKPLDFDRLVKRMRDSTSTEDFPVFKNPELADPVPLIPPPIDPKAKPPSTPFLPKIQD